jgi:phosphoribulokinase
MHTVERRASSEWHQDPALRGEKQNSRKDAVLRRLETFLNNILRRAVRSHVLELSAMVVSPANPASGQHTLPTPSRCTRHVLADGQGMSR